MFERHRAPWRAELRRRVVCTRPERRRRDFVLSGPHSGTSHHGHDRRIDLRPSHRRPPAARAPARAARPRRVVDGAVGGVERDRQRAGPHRDRGGAQDARVRDARRGRPRRPSPPAGVVGRDGRRRIAAQEAVGVRRHRGERLARGPVPSHQATPRRVARRPPHLRTSRVGRSAFPGVSPAPAARCHQKTTRLPRPFAESPGAPQPRHLDDGGPHQSTASTGRPGVERPAPLVERVAPRASRRPAHPMRGAATRSTTGLRRANAPGRPTS